MKWLSRLKKSSTHPETDATKATETLFVVSVAPILAPIQKFEGNPAPANDPAPTPIKLQALPPADSDSGEVIDIGTVRPLGLSAKLLAASMALDAQIHAAGLSPGNDPDGNHQPGSTAMNSAEPDILTARLARFTDKGVRQMDAESMADKLVIRDREQDDRRVCLECRHLSGYGHASWRCGNWQAAGIAIRSRDTQLPSDLVLQLQHCGGFTPYITATPQGTNDEQDRY